MVRDTGQRISLQSSYVEQGDIHNQRTSIPHLHSELLQYPGRLTLNLKVLALACSLIGPNFIDPARFGYQNHNTQTRSVPAR
jgi:hypothetical protein